MDGLGNNLDIIKLSGQSKESLQNRQQNRHRVRRVEQNCRSIKVCS